MPQDKNMAEPGLHVLYIPAWMPIQKNKAAGSFILQHAFAVHESTTARVGILHRSHHSVIPEVLQDLNQRGLTTHVENTFYLPKINTFAIRLWQEQYLKAFRRYVEQNGSPDVLHAHSYVAAIAGHRISQEFAIPHVITEHSTDFITGNIRTVFRPFIHSAFSAASAVIAVGEKLREVMENHMTRAILVIPNPVDPKIFYPAVDPQATALQIICVGSLTHRKRMGLMLKSLALLSDIDWRLHCVGQGPLQDKLKEQARKLGIDARITWHNHLPAASIAELIRKSHVLISLSSAETFSIVAAEALMCGVPVICTVSGGPETFVNPDNGVVLSSDPAPEEVAGTIREFWKNSDKYQRAEIALSAKSGFGSQEVARQIHDVYVRSLNQEQ